MFVLYIIGILIFLLASKFSVEANSLQYTNKYSILQ